MSVVEIQVPPTAEDIRILAALTHERQRSRVASFREVSPGVYSAVRSRLGARLSAELNTTIEMPVEPQERIADLKDVFRKAILQPVKTPVMQPTGMYALTAKRVIIRRKP